MNVKQLRYALKVASSGSFTQAARELYLSQPSLSKAILNLEKEYQIKIFERNPKGVYVTAEGKEFLYYAKKVITSVDAMDTMFTTQKVEKKSILSVATQQFDFIYDLLLQLYDDHRDASIHFNIVEGNRTHIIHSVLNGDVNIGLIVKSSGDTKLFRQMFLETNLEAHVLSTSEVFVSVGKHSPHYHKEIITFNDLVNQQQAVLDMENEAIQDLYISQSNYINTQKVLFFNTINACIAFLLNTDVHLFTPKWLIGFFEGHEIKTLQVTDQGSFFPSIDLVWLKRKNEALNVIEQEFIDNLNYMFSS